MLRKFLIAASVAAVLPTAALACSEHAAVQDTQSPSTVLAKAKKKSKKTSAPKAPQQKKS